MVAPITVPTLLGKTLLNLALGLGTPKVMLADAAWTPNQDTLQYANAVTNEAAGSSYSSPGVTLGGVTIVTDTATNKDTLTASDVTTSGLSVVCRWAVIHVYTGVLSTSPVLGYCDLSQGVGGNITCTAIHWNALGIIPIVAA